MTTTTIRLPEELKTRIAQLADAAGLTPHGFILRAVEQHVEDAEAHAQFVQEGMRRLAEMEASGEGIPLEEARQYLMDRAAGRKTRRPVPRKLVPTRRA